MLRICLIIVILAGLGAGAVNFFVVKEKITTTLDERDAFHKTADTETAAHKKFEKQFKETETKLNSTTKELTETKSERDDAVAKAGDMEKRANTATETLKKTTVERDAARNDLAAWNGLGIPLESIRSTLASLKSVTQERDAINAENKVLLATNHKLDEKLKALTTEDYEVKLPAGLKGNVLVADPKYEFVVLDIGEKQGVLEDGKLLVNRRGKLIAKVRVKSVQSDRCIANVLPGWKQEDIMEGDQVVY